MADKLFDIVFSFIINRWSMVQSVPLEIYLIYSLLFYFIFNWRYRDIFKTKDETISALKNQIKHAGKNTQESPDNTTKSLKKQLIELSDAIVVFVSKCEEDDMLIHDVLEDYRVHYNNNVVLLYEQAKEQGYSDDILDNIYRRPPLLSYMSAIAKKLRVVSDKMP